MNTHHEIAMLAAQMWGEANAENADPEQFGSNVAEAYASSYDALEAAEEFGDAIAYGVAMPGDATSELLRNIATKQAK